MLAEINRCVTQIDALISESDDPLPPNRELVLELMQADGDGLKCGYYFVDHENRCLFWVEPFNVSNLLWTVQGVTCASHVSASSWASYILLIHLLQISEHEIESQYWYVQNPTST